MKLGRTTESLRGTSQFESHSDFYIHNSQFSILNCLSVGRFTSIDKLWEKYAGWTPYQYSMNNPVNAKDDNGLNAYWFSNNEAKMTFIRSDNLGDDIYVTSEETGCSEKLPNSEQRSTISTWLLSLPLSINTNDESEFRGAIGSETGLPYLDYNNSGSGKGSSDLGPILQWLTSSGEKTAEHTIHTHPAGGDWGPSTKADNQEHNDLDTQKNLESSGKVTGSGIVIKPIPKKGSRATFYNGYGITVTMPLDFFLNPPSNDKKNE